MAVDSDSHCGVGIESEYEIKHLVGEANEFQCFRDIFPGHSVECLFCIKGKKEPLVMVGSEPVVDIDGFKRVISRLSTRNEDSLVKRYQLREQGDKSVG